MSAEAVAAHGHEHGSHASPGFYWAIGGILTVITAVEVAVFYIPALAGVPRKRVRGVEVERAADPHGFTLRSLSEQPLAPRCARRGARCKAPRQRQMP